MAELSVIILAAGAGKRMNSALPKLLHRVAGRTIIAHVVEAAHRAGAAQIGVVVGTGQTALAEALAAEFPYVMFFEQPEARGTAHAAQAARAIINSAAGSVAVVYGDHPLLQGQNFDAVLGRLDAGMDAAILGFVPADPTGYGRFITDGAQLLAIREERDASEEERQIRLCNACILAFKAEVFRALIDRVTDENAQGEFYITDLVEIANAEGLQVGYGIAPEADVMGVNSRVHLARAERLFQERRRREMLENGVTLTDPSSVYFSYDTKAGQDVLIEPNVFFGPGVTIGDNATIFAFSHIEGASIGAGAKVGPFARLRPGAELGADTKVGNFVEVKNAVVGEGAKLNHLTYVGDADVGAHANLGAGTVTCNYDGVNKHRTVIGADSFVGSNSSLVAPVTIGEGAYIASGSVVTEDVPADSAAFGRARQVNKPGHASKLREKAEAIKKARNQAK